MQNLFIVIPSLLPGLRWEAAVSPAPPELSKAGGCGKEMAHGMHSHICKSALLLATSAKWPEKGNGVLKNVLFQT